jgi:hypothetical protein
MKNGKEVFVVNTCNEWNEYASFRLVGIFTSRRKLNPILNKMLECGDISWHDDENTDFKVNSYTDEELQNQLEYVSIKIVTLNEEQ